MSYGFVMDVDAPATFYDALHAEIMRRSTDGADGLVLHLGRATEGGFQVVEVWESREACDRFMAAVVGPAIAALSDGSPVQPQPRMQEFEPRGLLVPSAGVVV